MSILTQKMVTAKAEFLTPNSAFFMPFNEGSGNVFTDLVSGSSITMDSAAHTKPHAATTVQDTSTSINGMPSPVGKNIIAFFIFTPVTSSAFATVAIGVTTFVITLDGSQVLINSSKGSAVTATVAGVTLGQTAIVACTFNKDTGELRSFVGVNGGVVSFENTADAAIHLDETEFSNQLQLGFSASFVPDYYTAYMHFPDVLPSDSDLITYLDWNYQQVLKGHKVIDKRITTL